MADYTVRRIDDMEAVFLGAFKRARAELGISAFGMQIIDMPAGVTQYPAHDHKHDGQEEVFVVLRGSGVMELDDDERIDVDPETMIRVGVETKRYLTPGDDGIRVLIISGVPGGVYEPSEITQLGVADPLAQQQT